MPSKDNIKPFLDSPISGAGKYHQLSSPVEIRMLLPNVFMAFLKSTSNYHKLKLKAERQFCVIVRQSDGA